jgi:hypothetical protein
VKLTVLQVVLWLTFWFTEPAAEQSGQCGTLGRCWPQMSCMSMGLTEPLLGRAAVLAHKLTLLMRLCVCADETSVQ